MIMRRILWLVTIAILLSGSVGCGKHHGFCNRDENSGSPPCDSCTK